MTRIVAIRPEPGLASTLAAGEAGGMAIEGRPLFEVGPLSWEAPALDTIDGLLLGSANALRHAGPGLSAYLGKPAYAVGETTAEAARKAGFIVAAVGSGGLQDILDGLAGRDLRLLRLAGSERVSLAPPDGIHIVQRIVYEIRPLPMPPELASSLREGAVVLLHSAAAARHFAAECDRLSVPRGSVEIAALGRRIAAAAGEGWAQLRSAREPREAALLALARDMCH